MARTRPNSALLKKMDPAPARLVARHSATTARLQPRRPIDTRHPAPAPAAAKTLTPRAPTPRPAPQNSPNKTHNPNTRPQHNPTSKPATRNHTKKHKPEPLTNSRERSGLESRVLELLGGRDYSMAELREDALLETIYKKTHVKPVVDRLIEQRRVELMSTGRSYADRVLRLAQRQLF